MRIQDTDIVTASCYNTMEGKDLSGAAVPTDIKLEPTNNDVANSNGILSPPTTPSNTTPAENEYTSASAGSGRFKFFKDGKFILELWHHKDGDRTTWYTPKSTTVWPPAGHCTPRQESSTSLSVSDDNSSIQSSPWQRDHCWKQSIPRKNVNRQLEFAMIGSRKWKGRFASIAIICRRRRKPYDVIKPLTVKKEHREELIDEVDGRTSSSSSSSSLLSWPPKKRILHQNCVGDRMKRLAELAQKLLERRTCEHAVSSCRTDPGIVSPRKRILKEMEKVSLEEMGNANKKHRAKTTTTFNATPCSTVTVMTGTVHCQMASAASPAITMISTATTTTTKSVNSHSISSILSRDEEPSFLRNLLKSPNEGGATSDAKNNYGESPNNVDVRNSRLSHCSTPVGASPSPPYLSSKGIHCPQPLSHYIPPTFVYSGATGTPFLPSPPPPPPPMSNHPPYYPAAYPWSVPAVSSLPRQSMYPAAAIPSYPGITPSPWVPIAHSSLQSYPMTENGTDVPLNLSKH